jgi:ABC-type amino acid transport substrate-binding protein
MRVVYSRLVVAVSVATVVPTHFAVTPANVVHHNGSRPQPADTMRPQTTSQSAASLELPLTFARHSGDLDGMVKRHEIRALVVPGRSSFFYDRGHPEGIYYEAFDEFQRFVNHKVKTGNLKITVAYIPVRPEQLEQALLEGVGDVVAYGVIVTPEREEKVLFTSPIYFNVKQVIVTGPKASPLANLEDLSGTRTEEIRAERWASCR